MKEFRAGEFIRISKYEARKRHNKCLATYIIPSNFRPDNMWCPVTPIPVKDARRSKTFDEFITEYTVYNCINKETGKYPAFYRKEKDE